MHLQLVRGHRLPAALGPVQTPRFHRKACDGVCHELAHPLLPGSLEAARGGLRELQDNGLAYGP